MAPPPRLPPQDRSGATDGLEPDGLEPDAPERRPPGPSRSTDSASASRSGRARPVYTPRSPPPGRWRPSRLARVVLGLVPGVRMMALDDARRGLPLAIFGLALALAFGILLTGWEARVHALERLRIVPKLALLDALCIVLIGIAYEALRLTASLEERRRSPWSPRIVAAPFFPALLVVLGAPSILHLSPRWLEALWWAALVAAVGSSPALVWCTFEDRLLTRRARRRLLLAWMVAAFSVGAAVAGPLALSAELRARMAAEAQMRGFQLLPRLLDGRG